MKQFFPIKVAILIFINLTACKAVQKSAEVPAPRQNTCATLLTSTPEPLADWKMQGDQHLVVCDMFQSGKDSDARFSGWLQLALKSDKGLLPLISEVKSETASNLQTFAVERKSAQQIVIERRLIVRPNEAEGKKHTSVVLSETSLDCSEKPCALQKPRCLKPAQTKAPADIALVQRVIAGKTKSLKLPNYDVLIRNVAVAAALGNEDAKKIMLATPPDKLHIDGAASEVYQEGRELLQSLKESGCL